jgi:small subunit ribosomal protein S6
MIRYETLFLTIPDFTNDEFSSLETAVSKVIQEAKGTMISFEKWGKYHLAFPVRDNDYGVYGLVRFEVDSAHKENLLQTLHGLWSLKYNDSVMRSMTVKLDPRKALAYHRPESLEEAPVRDADSYFKPRAGRDSDRPSAVHDEDEEEDSVEDIRRVGPKFDHAVAAAPEGN